MAVVVAGCGYKHEPTGALAPTFPITVHDAAGRPITLAHQPSTILVLDPAGARILKKLGAPATLTPPDAPVSQLRAQHPDLLIVPADTTTAEADSLARRVGAPTYVLAGFQLRAIEQGAAQLGLATGHALAGREPRPRAARSGASSSPGGSRARSRRRVFVDPASGTRSRRETLLATLVRVAGGRARRSGAAPARLPEAPRAPWTPTCTRSSARARITLDVLRKRKGSKNLAAIRSGRLLIVDDRLVQPDQDAYRALEQIARFLHPEAVLVIRGGADRRARHARAAGAARTPAAGLAAGPAVELEVSLDRCEAGMQAEMRYYAAHCARARDAAALAALRLECADVLADVLAAGANGAELLPCLTDAISFTAFPDAAPALAALSTQGRRLAVVSNWDVSLPPVLARLGLAARFEVIVHSAGAGAAKPDPLPFQIALERLSLAPDECVHVGDDPVNDGEGASAAGLRAILVDRAGEGGPGSRVRSLVEVPALLDRLEAA